MNKFIRENVYAAGLLTLIRLYLGWEWLSHGYDKLTKGFDASGFLKNAVAKPVLEPGTQNILYPNFHGFLEHFALPNAKLFNVMVPWGEFLIGAGLLLGCLTTAAAFFGLLMNFTFMFAGTVSTNPWFILLGSLILVAGANAGKFGADYYVLPYVRKWLRIQPAAEKQTSRA